MNKPAARPARASKTAALMNRLESLQGELTNLAWQDLTEGEKQELTNRLENLKQGADALLQAMGLVLM